MGHNGCASHHWISGRLETHQLQTVVCCQIQAILETQENKRYNSVVVSVDFISMTSSHLECESTTMKNICC